MALSTPEACSARVRAAIDPVRIATLSKKSHYALTGVWAEKPGYSFNLSHWPWYEDSDPPFLTAGRSNKILNANRTKKSRLLTGDIEPDSVGVSSFTSAARKAYWKARYDGAGNTDGSWRPHVFQAFDDFDLLGTGCAVAGLVQNPETGKRCASLRHVPLQNVVYDRHARNPENARWVSVRTFLPFEEAKLMFPNRAGGHMEHWSAGLMSEQCPVVQLIEYWDIGIAGNDPTYCAWLGDTTTHRVRLSRNPWGRMIPAGFFVNNLLPGARYAVGGVYTMMRTQEVLHEIEKSVLDRVRKGPVDVWNESLANIGDLNRARKGLSSDVRLSTQVDTSEIANVLQRHPGQQLTEAEVLAWQRWTEQFGEDAALSEIDQNKVLESQRTLGEIAQIQSASASNRAFDDQNVKEGLVSFVTKVFHVARAGDDDPVEVSVSLPDQSKSKMVVNRDDDSSCRELFDGRIEVVLDVSALTASDMRAKRLQRLEELNQLAPYAQAGAVSWEWLAQEVLTAIGEEGTAWKPQPQTNALQSLALGQGLEQMSPTMAAG